MVVLNYIYYYIAYIIQNYHLELQTLTGIREHCRVRGDSCFLFGCPLIDDPHEVKVHESDLRAGAPERGVFLGELFQQVEINAVSQQHILKLFKMAEVVYPYREEDTNNPNVFPAGKPVYYLLGYRPFETVKSLAGATMDDLVCCLSNDHRDVAYSCSAGQCTVHV